MQIIYMLLAKSKSSFQMTSTPNNRKINGKILIRNVKKFTKLFRRKIVKKAQMILKKIENYN